MQGSSGINPRTSSHGSPPSDVAAAESSRPVNVAGAAVWPSTWYGFSITAARAVTVRRHRRRGARGDVGEIARVQRRAIDGDLPFEHVDEPLIAARRERAAGFELRRVLHEAGATCRRRRARWPSPSACPAAAHGRTSPASGAGDPRGARYASVRVDAWLSEGVSFTLPGSRFSVRVPVRCSVLGSVLGSRLRFDVRSAKRAANQRTRARTPTPNREPNPEPEHEPRSENREA